MYVNDLYKVLIHSLLFLFADDTVLVAHGHTIDDTIYKINEDLKNINQYCSNNELYLNVEKCKALIVNYKESIPFNQIKLNNCCLEIVDQYKYLGFRIDTKLSFNGQMNHIINKISYCNAVFSRISHFVEKSTLLMIYKSCYTSHFV